MNIPKITPLDARFGIAAQQRWDNLIKPRGGLGLLEEVVTRLCGIQKQQGPT